MSAAEARHGLKNYPEMPVERRQASHRIIKAAYALIRDWLARCLTDRKPFSSTTTTP